MSTARLYTVFDYLATLIAEREPDEPFMLTQLLNAIQYKFPDFTFQAYEIAGLKEFIVAGEKAGYFKLANTGSLESAYLVPGARQAVAHSGPTATGSGEAMGANDPRLTRWMQLTAEHLLSAERADQLVHAIQGVEALSPEFDAFLVAEMVGTPMYLTRGKLQRLREFLATYRLQGEAQAEASWQISRSMVRMPNPPPVEGASRAQSLIWALLQGTTTFAETKVEALDEFFFGMLAFSREQMLRNKAWDWVRALDLIEAEARSVPRSVAVVKTGLFGGKRPPVPGGKLDEALITAIGQEIAQAVGMTQPKPDDFATWRAFVETPSLDASLRFLAEHQELVGNDRLLAWLEDEISQNVAANVPEAVRNLANKAALVIGVRQFGVEGLRQNSGELKNTYNSVMDGARLLGLMFIFLQASNVAQAVQAYAGNPQFADAALGPLFEDQIVKAAHEANIAQYRLVSERMDLWRNLLDFGAEEGVRQHERTLASGRSDKIIQAEMGILLLAEATTSEQRQDIIGQYPAVASQEGLAIIVHLLDVLSFQNANNEVYNRHFDIKRLIERCLQLGIDRALAEMK